MAPGLSTYWASIDPFARGLKLGGLMNQSIEEEKTLHQGRHHFMTAINQIMAADLALEQTESYFRASKITYSLSGCRVAKIVIPLGLAYLASHPTENLYLVKSVNFFKIQWSRAIVVATLTATVGLFVLGETLLATTTLCYLSVGALNRYNCLPSSTQKVIGQADFFIANLTGLYFGGNFVRIRCMMRLANALTRFQGEKIKTEKPMTEALQPKIEIFEGEEEKFGQTISLTDLRFLTNSTNCRMLKSHLQKKPLPGVGASVKIDDLLDLYDHIDWSKHEHVLTKKLAKDKRWLEIGRFKMKPLKYLESNFRHLIESIKNRDIVVGKLASYDMLAFYCRFIAQELKNQDEMIQADMLMWLGIEGGEYCGTGKFGIVEEVYENLLSQASGVSLETRVLACAQQERQRIWQNIYLNIWKSSPVIQLWGYLTEITSIHNATKFMNLVQAGEKFGLPHQAAKNDQMEAADPLDHLSAIPLNHAIGRSFFESQPMPLCYLTIGKEKGWKFWERLSLKCETVYQKGYTEKNILACFSETIGTAQISKTDIYVWWQQWIERQDDLTNDEKNQLMDQLQSMPIQDSNGNVSLIFDNAPFEVNGEIQSKFLIAMLIEMGIFETPFDFPSKHRGKNET